MITVSRRGLLVTAALVPGAALAGQLIAGLGRAAAAFRPAAEGRSSTRCATCGAAGHHMLDGRCPAQPGSRALRGR